MHIPYLHTYIYMQTLTLTHTHKYIHEFIHAHTRARARAHTHTCTHTYMHTNTQKVKPLTRYSWTNLLKICKLSEHCVKKTDTHRLRTQGIKHFMHFILIIHSPTSSTYVSKATLGKLLKCSGAHMGLPMRTDTVSNGTLLLDVHSSPQQRPAVEHIWDFPCA